MKLTPRQINARAMRRQMLLAPVERWMAQTKAELIQAVRTNFLTEDEARKAHNISPEEWAKWNADYDKGLDHLRVTPKTRVPA